VPRDDARHPLRPSAGSARKLTSFLFSKIDRRKSVEYQVLNGSVTPQFLYKTKLRLRSTIWRSFKSLATTARLQYNLYQKVAIFDDVRIWRRPNTICPTWYTIKPMVQIAQELQPCKTAICGSLSLATAGCTSLPCLDGIFSASVSIIPPVNISTNTYQRPSMIKARRLKLPESQLVKSDTPGRNSFAGAMTHLSQAIRRCASKVLSSGIDAKIFQDYQA
jgi:hypothetical protein